MMNRMSIQVTVKATVDYDFKYSGSLTEEEVAEIINSKYSGNVWMALMDNFIDDIDCEIVDEVLSGIEQEVEE